MADPLSMAASILAVLGTTYSSAKALYDLIDELANAPQIVGDMKTDLSSVQAALTSLEVTLKEGDSTALAPVFERVGLRPALEACSAICADFTATIKKYMTYSTASGLGKRGRLTITFRKTKLEALRARLNGSKDTIELAVTSAILATSTSSQQSAEDLKTLLLKQEKALKYQTEQLTALENSMKDLAIDEKVEDDPDNDVIPITRSERDLTLTILPVLKKVCKEASSIADARIGNTYQEFQKIIADDYSRAQAGVVGSDLGNAYVEQKFGDAEAKGSSEVFLGRMGNQAFKDFWNRPLPKPDSAPEIEK